MQNEKTLLQGQWLRRFFVTEQLDICTGFFKKRYLWLFIVLALGRLIEIALFWNGVSLSPHSPQIPSLVCSPGIPLDFSRVALWWHLLFQPINLMKFVYRKLAYFSAFHALWEHIGCLSKYFSIVSLNLCSCFISNSVVQLFLISHQYPLYHPFQFYGGPFSLWVIHPTVNLLEMGEPLQYFSIILF